MEKNWSYTIPEGEHKGVTLWSGRYCAVCAIVMIEKGGDKYLLINKRGKGTPNEIGKYNITCGFLEANETGQQGCSRELREECGYYVAPEKFKLYGVSTKPQPNDVNVTIRYIAKLQDFPQKVQAHGGEKDEVESVHFINIKDYKKYNWAFNHKKMIEKMIKSNV